MKSALDTVLNALSYIILIGIIVFIVFPFKKIGVSFPVYIVESKLIINTKYIILGLLFAVQIGVQLIKFIVNKLNSKNTSNSFATISALIILVYLVYIGSINYSLVTVLLLVWLINFSIKDQSINLFTILMNITLYAGVLLSCFYNLPFELYGLMVSNFLLFISVIFCIINIFIKVYNAKKIINAPIS